MWKPITQDVPKGKVIKTKTGNKIMLMVYTGVWTVNGKEVEAPEFYFSRNCCSH